MAKRQPGDTFKKGGKSYRVSSSGKPFRSSNSAKANQQRALNTRLAQPIANIPGTSLTSGLTERDLAHEAGAATTVKYGPSEQAIAEQLTQAVQQKTDTNAWYADYQNRLQSYQQQAGAYQQGANDAMLHLQQGVTGLGQQDQGFVQQQQAAAPAGTAPVGASVGQNANAALAVRQGIAGNFGVNQANVGAANNTYASNLANVVGPQQRLTALATKQGGINTVLKRKTALKGEEGAYNQEYRSNRRNDETKNLLAAGALGIDATNAKTSADKAAATAANNSPEAKAQNTATGAQARVAANNGYTLKEWQGLSSAQRSKIIAAGKKKTASGSDPVITSGPFAGKRKSQIDAMTPAQIDKLVNKTKPTSGPGSITTDQENKTVGKVKQLSQLMKNSTWPGGPRKGQRMTAEQVRHHYQAQGVDDDIIRLAYSLVKNNGKLGPDGVRAAHALGIHVGGRWGQVKLPTGAGTNTNYGGGAGAGSGTS